VATFDWRTSASTFLPGSAATNAANLATQYVSQIVAANYDAVHLIAHSAGSWFIDSLVTGIENVAPTIVTQATFLDAYTPSDKANVFGTDADYAEHYVDKGFLPSTNSDLTHAVNLDLSLWGPDSTEDTLSLGVAGHSWPWQWYLATTSAPETSRWGFAVSLSYSTDGLPDEADGTVIVLGQTGDSNDDGQFDTSDLIAAFAGGKFESDEAARWFEGDWNGDGRFDTGDLVLAFQAGTYLG
ncbi:MAG: hypothetical protein KDB23_30425, partial [Planctomycetales bacterium]|nr:hypothetical protein [Planctomycetales bacterium]